MEFSCPLCEDTAHQVSLEPKYNRCDQCALIYLLPAYHLNSDAELERYRLHEHPEEDPGYEAYLSPLKEALTQRVPKGTLGLDYGSGPQSRFKKMLEREGYALQVYDPYFAPDSTLLENRYSFVSATEVCEHFYQPGTEFEKLRNLLAPGGVLGIMTQMYDGVDFKTWYYRREPSHVVFYSKETFHWIGERFRFRDVCITDKKTAVLMA